MKLVHKIGEYEDQASWWIKHYEMGGLGRHTGKNTREHIKRTYILAEKQIEFAQNFSELDKVLELGCYQGWLIKWLTERYSIEGIAVDVCEAPNIFLSEEKNIKVVICDLKQLDLGSKFSLIVSSFVLQHMVKEEDFYSFYSVVNNHLKEGGIFVLHDRLDGGVVDINKKVRGIEEHKIIWDIFDLKMVFKTDIISDDHYSFPKGKGIRFSVFLKKEVSVTTDIKDHQFMKLLD